MPPIYSRRGERLWRAAELTYALGERVMATQAHHRMAFGECGTIVEVPEFIRREYIVLPDSLAEQFLQRSSGLYLSRMPEHLLAPER